MMEKYYKYNIFCSSTFCNQKVQDRYTVSRQKRKNVKVMIPIFIFALATMPMTVQFRALRGDLGQLWMLSTLIFIFSTCHIGVMILSEIFKDKIERILISKGVHYYSYSEMLNILFFIYHTININFIMYLRSLKICEKDKDTSIFDNHFCNSIHGIPLDTFSMQMFFSILYQVILGLPYIYIFLSKIVEFLVLALIIYDSASIETFPLISITFVMFLGIIFLQYYLDIKTINSFILEDKIKSYDCFSNAQNFNGFVDRLQTSQSVKDTIFYHEIEPVRKSSYSDSKIKYDEFLDYECSGSRSSTLTSLTSSI